MTSRGERMRLVARTLPILALIAWVVTIWVPVLDSAAQDSYSPESLRIVVTSLGHRPFEFGDAAPKFLVIWICLLTCMVSAWLVAGLRAWSWATMVLGVLVIKLLIDMMADPPIAMWDGQNAKGEGIGGMVVGYPAMGAAFWAVGAIALLAAGILGLIGERLRKSEQPGEQVSDRSNYGHSARIDRWFAAAPRRDGQVHVRRHRTSAERAARLLALMSIVAWMVMIWVPILDSGTRGNGSVVVTSLGRLPIGTDDFNLGVLLPWMGVLFGAAVVWLIDSPRWWSAVVIVIGLALFVMLPLLLLDPPTAYSTVEDSAGEVHGVTIVGRPAPGVSYWSLGSGTLVMAGLLSFVGDRLRADKRLRYSGAPSPK